MKSIKQLAEEWTQRRQYWWGKVACRAVRLFASDLDSKYELVEKDKLKVNDYCEHAYGNCKICKPNPEGEKNPSRIVIHINCDGKDCKYPLENKPLIHKDQPVEKEWKYKCEICGVPAEYETQLLIHKELRHSKSQKESICEHEPCKDPAHYNEVCHKCEQRIKPTPKSSPVKVEEIQERCKNCVEWEKMLKHSLEQTDKALDMLNTLSKEQRGK